jgi:hypothetical protein
VPAVALSGGRPAFTEHARPAAALVNSGQEADPMASGNKATALPAGAELIKSELGGLALNYRGVFVGWVHSSGDMWNTYLRQPRQPDGAKLGRFPLDEAVAAILQAYRTRAGE